MLNYDSVIVGETIFMIETGPVVLEMIVLDKFLKDGEERLKLKGSDLTFEINFSDINADTFSDKDEAGAHAIKHIFDAANDLIKELSENNMNDYYDVEVELEKYKELFPEIFI